MHWRKERLEPLIIDGVRKISGKYLDGGGETNKKRGGRRKRICKGGGDTLTPGVSSADWSCVCTPLVLTGAAGASAIVRDEGGGWKVNRG